MKFCPSCGWSNSDLKTKCSKCGTVLAGADNVVSAPNTAAAAPQQSSVSSAGQTGYTPPAVIQARGQNCTAQVEQGSTTVAKFASNIAFTGVVGGLLVLASNYIAAILDGTDFSRVGPPATYQVVLAIVFAVFGFVSLKKLSQKGQENLDVYRHYCATETLVVDSEKIYGTTSRENVNLHYNMIEGVRYRPAVNSSGQFHLGRVECDVLEVLGKDKKIYTFHSFTNAKELKLVIEMNIANQR